MTLGGIEPVTTLLMSKGLTLDGPCDVCELGKQKRVSFGIPVKERAKEILGLVHTDLLTVEQESIKGAKYAVMFTDDLSRFRFIYFLKKKSDTLAAMEQFMLDA